MNDYEYLFEDSITYKKPQTKKFMVLSFLLHSVFAAALLFITLPAFKSFNKNEPIIIEFETLSKSEDTKLFFQSSPPPTELPTEPQTKPQSKPQAKTETAAPKISKQIVKQAIVTKASAEELPATIDDIATPELDFDSALASNNNKLNVDKKSEFDESELESEFKNIDQAQANQLAQENEAFDKEIDQVANTNDQALKALENKFTAESQLMEQALQQNRNKNAAALAQLKAQEELSNKAALSKKAALSNGLNFNKNATQNPEQYSEQFSGQNSDENSVKNIGQISNQNSGQAQAQPSSQGQNKGQVRSLSQLKQVPGNPLPQYSNIERLNREQGKVIFQAFVTSAGQLTKFRLLQSTGYKNLDGKSLKALKQWKFYPGQEGWVEIPQVWSLKGQTEEMPALLKRQARNK